MKKKQGNTSSAAYDKKHVIGKEPDPKISSNIDLIKLLNWYNYAFTAKDTHPWLLEWMKNQNYSQQDQKQVRQTQAGFIGITAGSLARIALRGGELPERSLEFIRNKIQECLSRSPEEQEAITIVRDAFREKLSSIIGTIEEAYDALDEGFTPYEFYKTINASKQIMDAVTVYYLPLRTELQQVLTGKDPDLKYGYRHLTKEQVRRRIAFLDMVIGDAKSLKATKVAVRKPRAAKKVSVSSQVKDLHYLKEDPELKLSSVDPTNIPGALVLWVYNAKYKQVIRYEAFEGGFQVKGSTKLLNVKYNATEKKSVRNPAEFLSVFVQGNKNAMNKAFAALKSKLQTNPPSLNRDMVLLKVFK